MSLALPRRRAVPRRTQWRSAYHRSWIRVCDQGYRHRHRVRRVSAATVLGRAVGEIKVLTVVSLSPAGGQIYVSVGKEDRSRRRLPRRSAPTRQ
jgi:hypothetical protein